MTCPASSDRGANNVMSYITHTHTLVDSFNALADEVQSLTDRNTILEHKLRFAHEQVRTIHLCLTICQQSLALSMGKHPLSHHDEHL